MENAIVGLHHVGLPSMREQWETLQFYWESLGLDVWQIEITDPDYDTHGAGPRLQVGRRPTLMISYFIGTGPGHVALELAPQALALARKILEEMSETHWGHSVTSLFPTAPYTSPVHPGIELVTKDTDFHHDDK